MSALPAPPPEAARAAAPAVRGGSGQEEPPLWLRAAVRDLLSESKGFGELSQEDRRSLARAMVRVSAMAAQLLAEEGEAQAELDRARAERAEAGPPPPGTTRAPARALEAPEFGTSAERIAGITRNVLGAVSFPRFVTDLINGVFRSMLDSTAQQMQMYVQLLGSVSASLDGFERTQFSTAQVRQWVADHFPDSIEYDVPETEPGEEVDPEELANIRLRLRPGASMPGEEELRAALGAGPEERIEAGNPEALVPLARRQIARQRQQMLATMVMMGMQRIVIDSGKINASMRFHIDTRSAATEDRGSQFGMQNRVRGSGSFGVGPWGASAEVENTITYVTTQRSQNTEEINTDLELNSSVELNFRTDYLPLNRMAAQAQADRIRNASLNPTAETDPARAREARLNAQLQAEQARRGGVNTALTGAGAAPPATTGTTAGGGSAGRGGGGGTSDAGASGAGRAAGGGARPADTGRAAPGTSGSTASGTGPGSSGAAGTGSGASGTAGTATGSSGTATGGSGSTGTGSAGSGTTGTASRGGGTTGGGTARTATGGAGASTP
jgi:hypothetical protein